MRTKIIALSVGVLAGPLLAGPVVHATQSSSPETTPAASSLPPAGGDVLASLQQRLKSDNSFCAYVTAGIGMGITGVSEEQRALAIFSPMFAVLLTDAAANPPAGLPAEIGTSVAALRDVASKVVAELRTAGVSDAVLARLAAGDFDVQAQLDGASGLPIPSMPEFTLPDLTDFTLPDLTDVTIPGLTDFTIPGLTDFTLPDFTAMSLPGLTDLTLPDFTDFTIPNLTLPPIFGALGDIQLGTPGATFTAEEQAALDAAIKGLTIDIEAEQEKAFALAPEEVSDEFKIGSVCPNLAALDSDGADSTEATASGSNDSMPSLTLP